MSKPIPQANSMIQMPPNRNMQMVNIPFQNQTNIPIQGNQKSLEQMEESQIFITNIHPEMDEVTLYSEFSPFGKIFTLRIMKDQTTKKSRGIAYITYERKEQALLALKEMNNKELFNRQLVVIYKKEIKNLNKDSNLIIKNLSRDVTSSQLEEECRKFGIVISCLVRKEEIEGKLQSLGYAFVQFQKKEDAEKFKNDFNHKEINGHLVEVETYLAPSQRIPPKSSNVYMKNFPAKFTKEDVEKFITEKMEPHGKIISKGVFISEKIQKFYAFVAFETPEIADIVIKALTGYKLEGQTDEPLYVGFAQTAKQRRNLLMYQPQQSTTNMYIRSLKMFVTKEILEEVCNKHGKITSIFLKQHKIKIKENTEFVEKQCQFGFINFETKEQAKEFLINYKNDKDLIRLFENYIETQNYVYNAQTKKQRQQFLLTKRNTIQYQSIIHMQQSQLQSQQFQNNLPFQQIGQLPYMPKMANQPVRMMNPPAQSNPNAHMIKMSIQNKPQIPSQQKLFEDSVTPQEGAYKKKLYGKIDV